MPSSVDPKDMVKILRDILTEVGKLDDSQLLTLLSGAAKFKYINPDEIENNTRTRSTPNKKAPSSSQQVDATLFDAIRDYLKQCKSVEDAEDHIKKQKLSAPDLRALANHLGLVVGAKATIKSVIFEIVSSMVGSRLSDEGMKEI
jgi:hypothetical protein